MSTKIGIGTIHAGTPDSVSLIGLQIKNRTRFMPALEQFVGCIARFAIEMGLTNYPARRAASSIPCLQRFIVSTFTEVVRALSLMFQ